MSYEFFKRLFKNIFGGGFVPNTLSNFSAPVRPYDSSIQSDFSMYDHMPYVRDISICGNDMVKMSTGNIVKHYHYNNSKPCQIENNSTVISNDVKPLTGTVENNATFDNLDFINSISAQSLDYYPNSEDLSENEYFGLDSSTEDTSENLDALNQNVMDKFSSYDFSKNDY